MSFWSVPEVAELRSAEQPRACPELVEGAAVPTRAEIGPNLSESITATGRAPMVKMSRDRSRAHGENVAQDSAHAGGCALKRLDERRMIVRFDLESTGPAVADVDDAGIFARSLQDTLAARGQALQVDAR